MIHMNPSVRLEPLSESHVPEIMGWVNDPDVMGYFANRQKPITADDERAYIRSLTQSNTDKAWSVFDDNTGEYVGQCSINSIYWPAKNGRVFLVVTSTQQGRGYGSAILEALKWKAFEGMGFHKLWLIVREDNLKAQAKYVRAGFAFEGVLRDEYYVRGRYHNMVRMGILNPA